MTQEATIIDRILDLFQKHGAEAYHGEQVSQTEHALQAAWAAEREGATPALIAAALLHDVGHLLHDLGEDCTEREIDDCHEARGAMWLRNHFGPEVTEPIRLHVPAKRYLCAAEPGYFEQLSPASVQSLRLQGGPMSKEEVEKFRTGPHAQASLALRRWDEAAKVPGLSTPDLTHFRPILESVHVSTR